jgi:hypothetical protein
MDHRPHDRLGGERPDPPRQRLLLARLRRFAAAARAAHGRHPRRPPALSPEQLETETLRLLAICARDGVRAVVAEACARLDLLDALADACHRAGLVSEAQYLDYLRFPHD